MEKEEKEKLLMSISKSAHFLYDKWFHTGATASELAQTIIRGLKSLDLCTCKTCRFRGKKEHWERADYRECEASQIFYEYAEVGPGASPDHSAWLADGLMYADSDGYGAELFTAPDFGCVHHEIEEQGK